MNDSLINPQILGEAADWLVQLHSGTATAADHRAIEQWRNRSSEHARAWQRAEAVLGDFRNVPAAVAVQTLQRASRQVGLSRRQTIVRLGLMMMAGPLGFAAQHAPWEQWTADQRTAVGEQKALSLPDGSQLLLNTHSALNIAFKPYERRVNLLGGEVLFNPAADSAARPFIVQTPQGSIHALGGRFCVRIIGACSQVSVLTGVVQVSTGSQGLSAMVNTGERRGLRDDRLDPLEPFDSAALAWDKGMLMANNMRLDEVLQELARYRPGVLRCHPDVAGLRVSGAFSLLDSDASLRLLADSLPVKISSLSRYWLSVEPLA